MSLLYFLALAAWLQVLLLRLFRRDRRLSVPEQFAAAFTLHFLYWIALSFLLGFLESFRFERLLDAGLLGILLLQFGTFLTRRHDQVSVPIWKILNDWLRELNGISRIVATFGILGALHFFYIGVRMPPVSYDALSYHLGLAVHLFQDGDFRSYPGESFMNNHFARGIHLLMAISIMLSGTIQFVNVIQWLILPVLVLAVYGVLRAFSVERSLATIGAMLPLSIPVLLYQSSLAYADLFATGWFAIGACAVLGALRFDGAGPGRMVWMFGAAGLALASKMNAIPHCLILGIAAILLWGWRIFLEPRWNRLGAAACGFLLAAAVGLPWPMRNWIQYGSPTYPIMLTNSTEGLDSWEYPRSLAVVISDGPALAEISLLEKSWRSWRTIDFQSWKELGFLGHRLPTLDRDALLAPTREYSGHRHFGETLLVWILVLLPAMIASLILEVFLTRNGDRRRGTYLAGVVAIPAFGFVSTICAYWAVFYYLMPIIGRHGLLAPTMEYSGYRQFGETGLLWILILLPAMIVAAILAAVLVGGNDRRRGFYLAGLVAIPLFAYGATISAYWARLSIFLPVLGCVAFVIVLDQLKRRLPLAGHVLLALALAAALFDWSTAVFLNRQPERARRYFREAQPASYTPIHYASWLSPHDPWIAAVRYIVEQGGEETTISYWTPIPEPHQPAFTGYFANEDATLRQFLFPSIWPNPFAISEEDKLRHLEEEQVRFILLSDRVPETFVEKLKSRGVVMVFRSDGFSVYKL